MYLDICIYICIHINVLIAPTRQWIFGPWADPQRALGSEGRLGPDVGAPWDPGPAPLRGQGPLWPMGPCGNRPMAQGSMA